MPFFETVGFFLLCVTTAMVCGYGVVTLLWPREYEAYRFVVLPPFGYAVFCWLTYLVSGSFGLRSPTACLLSFAMLAGLSLYAFFATRERWANVRGGLLDIAKCTWPVLLVMIWPLFYVGARTYVGANNPDWFAGLMDNFFLRTNSVHPSSLEQVDMYYILKANAGRMPLSARFSSGLFAILLEQLFRLDSRTALSTALGLFVFCIPLSTYFAARVAFGFSRLGGLLAAFFIGISGPTAMSYLYYYIGQNSGLGILPLALGLGVMMVSRPSWRTIALGAIIINSYILMYLGMLPYAAAPVGFVGLYLLLSGKMKLKECLLILGGLGLFCLVTNFGMLSFLLRSFRGWGNVVGQTLQGQYFLDFLTEHFLIVLYGLTSYPVVNSYLYNWLQELKIPMMPALFVLVGLVTVFSLSSTAAWVKAQWRDNKAAIVCAFSAFVVYAIVWYVYSFQRQYGYAAFKMNAWVQYLVVLPYAYGFERLWRRWQNQRAAADRVRTASLLAVFGVVIVGGNVVSTTRFAVFGLGHDNKKGSIINNYEMSGNYDYLALNREVASRVPSDQSVGILFPDSIQNHWIAYYLPETKLSMLSHAAIPGDDENLPDIVTRRVVDYYGNVQMDRNPYFHERNDDFYLTWNKGHLNEDIVKQELPEPLWQNKTFRLLDGRQVKNLLFTGRGWYRIEYSKAGAGTHWWPDVFRFTSEGGEVYMLRATQPGKPYRMAFNALVGYGNPSNKRTLELWHNDKKIDEVEVEASARVLSKAFYPVAGVNRFVIKVQERSEPSKRRHYIWNKDVPIDYRRTNVAVANFEVFEPGQDSASSRIQRSIEGDALFTQLSSYSGLEPDLWATGNLKISALQPPQAQTVELQLMIPSDHDYTFPYEIRYKVNGREGVEKIAAAGMHALRLPVSKGAPLTVLELSARQFKTYENKDIDIRSWKRAYRVTGLKFQ